MNSTSTIHHQLLTYMIQPPSDPECIFKAPFFSVPN